MRESITDGVITIRRYRPDDAEDLFRAARESVQEVYPWLPWCRPDFGLGEAETWIAEQIENWESGSAFEFHFRDHQDNYVGGGGINSVSEEHPFANLGYWTCTKWSRRGYGSRAARLLAEFGITDLGLKRVEIVAAVGNMASQRVAEKAGATREGILRNRLVLHNQAHDAVMFSFIPEDREPDL